MRVLTILPLAALFVLLGSCRMPEDPMGDPNYKPMFTVEKPSDDTSLEDIATLEPPEPPQLAKLPAIYLFDSLPVRGQATPNTDIVVKSSAMGAVAGRVGSDGTFCVDLPLAANTTQEISARVHNGLFSDYATTTITQEGGTTNDTPDTPRPTIFYRNVALGKNVYSDPYPEGDGLVNELTDGNESKMITFKEGSLSDNYIWIDLEEVYEIYKVDLIFSTAEEEYPDEITVFTSTAKNIDDYPSEDNWGEEAEVMTIKTNSQSIVSNGGLVSKWLPTNPEARFIGFALNHTTNIRSKYNVLSEIKVTVLSTEEEEEEQTPIEELTTPTCANGLVI